MKPDRTIIQIVFQPGEKLPVAGDTILLQGLAGRYAVTLHHIIKQETEANGIHLTARATKRLLAEEAIARVDA